MKRKPKLNDYTKEQDTTGTMPITSITFRGNFTRKYSLRGWMAYKERRNK